VSQPVPSQACLTGKLKSRKVRHPKGSDRITAVAVQPLLPGQLWLTGITSL